MEDKNALGVDKGIFFCKIKQIFSKKGRYLFFTVIISR